MTIGIIGAGKLGVTLAQLALKAGYNVLISGSGNPERIRLSTQIITPGAEAVTTEEAAARADIIILAFPLSKLKTLNPKDFAGKLVIDGMNYWPEVDGPLTDIIGDHDSTSEAVQAHLAGSTVVKALNHMGYHNLRDESRAPGAKGRKAVAIASDDEKSIHKVGGLVDNLGFDPLYIGKLGVGQKLEIGQPAFGASLPKEQLDHLLGSTKIN